MGRQRWKVKKTSIEVKQTGIRAILSEQKLKKTYTVKT